MDPMFRGVIKNEIKPLQSVKVNLSNGTRTIQAQLVGKNCSLPLEGNGIGEPKPVASFDEMVVSLKKRIQIKDSDEGKLLTLIRENSYYRISYFAKLLFRSGQPSKPNFDDFYALIKLDSYIRASVSRLTPSIEMFAKATLTHELLEIKSDSDIYLDHNIYKHNTDSDKKKLDCSLSMCTISILREKKRNESIKHYISHHDGHIPIWAFLMC